MGMDNIFTVVECDDKLWVEYEQFRKNSTLQEYLMDTKYEDLIFKNSYDICSFRKNYALHDYIESNYNLNKLEVRLQPYDLIKCANYMRKCVNKCKKERKKIASIKTRDDDFIDLDDLEWCVEECDYEIELYRYCALELTKSAIKTYIDFIIHKNKKLIYICSI